MLENSRLCSKKRTRNGIWRLQKGFNLSTAESVVDAHNKVCSNDKKGLLNDDPYKRISKVAFEGCYFIVEEFFIPGTCERYSLDCRRWIDNWKIGFGGIPIVRYDAWLRSTTGNGYLVSTVLDGKTLDKAIITYQNHQDYMNWLIFDLKKLVCSLYELGIYFKPLNPKKMIVCESPLNSHPRIYLTTMGQIQFNVKISDWHREQNFLQFIEPLPKSGDLTSWSKTAFIN